MKLKIPTPKFNFGDTVSFEAQTSETKRTSTCGACAGVGNIMLLEKPYRCPVCEGKGGKDETIYTPATKTGVITGIRIAVPPQWSNDEEIVYVVDRNLNFSEKKLELVKAAEVEPA